VKGVVFLFIHTVKPGDSVYAIAKAYGIPVQKIIDDNYLDNPERLIVGQNLIISGDSMRHTVASGQSLYSIARKYGTTVEQILKANPSIANPARISAGQIINIPLKTAKLGTIEVNGYAFANIEAQVLNSTLPHLTYLSIFSYQVRPDGTLAPINDAHLIEAARQARVAPMMVISNIEEGASFSSELAHTILTDEKVQNSLIDNVIKILNEKNYFGLDIDFEYIFRTDRENYNAFLRKIGSRLRALGYILTTAVAPKTSSAQRGLLYEAHDYVAHGQLVDHIIIMTYEWGYTYGPAQAVAPANQVAKVLSYAVSVIPSQKILMGMPNYGYDWTLPFAEGSAAKTLSNSGALELAYRVRANIQYDVPSQSPYFYYYDQDKKRHAVWFDDARSIKARLELVDRYNLGGVSYWTINRFYPQNWIVLESMYNVKKLL